MKKASMILAALVLITSAVFAQKRETREVATFTKISFRTGGKLYLKQGSPQKVEIDGSSEALEKIKTKVEGGKLVIGPEDKWMNWNWSNDDKVIVYVTVSNIDALSVNGSGNLIAQTKITTSGNIDLGVSGSGTLTGEFEAGDADCDVSGSGQIDIKGKFKSLTADVSGSGTVSVNGAISGKADFEISGSGKVEASGSAESLNTDISGSGRVRGANLVVNTARIDISGSGDVEITVNKDLDAEISGSGTVLYKGNPSHVNSNASGSGSVKKM